MAKTGRLSLPGITPELVVLICPFNLTFRGARIHVRLWAL